MKSLEVRAAELSACVPARAAAAQHLQGGVALESLKGPKVCPSDDHGHSEQYGGEGGEPGGQPARPRLLLHLGPYPAIRTASMCDKVVPAG